MYLTRLALAFVTLFLPFCTTISHFYRSEHCSLSTTAFNKESKTANNAFGAASALMNEGYVFTECYKPKAKEEGNRKRQGVGRKGREYIRVWNGKVNEIRITL